MHMKPFQVAFLAVAVMVGCATSDPISRFAAKPPDESDKCVAIPLPATASPEQVVREVLEPLDTEYKVLEVRQISIRGGKPCTAVLVELHAQGQRIVLLGYVGEQRGGWWTYVFKIK